MLKPSSRCVTGALLPALFPAATLLALCTSLVTACGPGPLPPEHPTQAPEKRADVVPVIQESTSADPEAKTQPAPPPPPKAAVTFENVGLATPESVAYDAVDDVYYVSNINGSAFEADDNGFISKLTPDGKVAELKLIDGAAKEVTLNAPKGLTLVERTLFVTDISFVRSFDLKTGKVLSNVEIKGSTFLKDIDHDDAGNVYVSDSGFNDGFEPSGTDAVYKIDKKGKVTPLIKSKELLAPNGLVWTKDKVYLATYRSKEILSVDAKGTITKEAEAPAGSLDGLLLLSDGRFLVASWEASAVFAGKDKLEPVVSDVPSPADIGLDTKRNRVLVPLFKKDRVEVHQL